jgi:glucokinase
MKYSDDKRIVLTLDAGGTNFVFEAIRGNQKICDPVSLPAEVKDLNKSLETIVSGFKKVMDLIDGKPSAISFAFPGPADYPNGVIDNVGNLPAFAGGVALGPYLEEQFDLPVFINNDGDLFVYGEAIGGLLPRVNKMLEDAGSPKRYETLFGVTLGTGFGGGLVHKGELFIGDNSNATEIWLMRNKVRPECFAEEGASIRAVQGSYARHAKISIEDAPTPKEIEAIAQGELEGNQQAAMKAYRELGEVVGDALSNAMTLFDGLVVIGGGISKAHKQFMPALVGEMEGTIFKYDGETVDRIVQKVFNLEAAGQVQDFLKGAKKEITVPGSARKISYDPLKRIGVGVSTMGTSRAVSIGAYAFALNEIDKHRGNLASDAVLVEARELVI